jgi:biopolymer transport protein ExbD/biopolymer transport protein TolR
VVVTGGTLTRPPRRRIVPEMNVTPLVDVVLVLLIIFMVVTPMMEHAARVDLPGVVHVDPENKGRMDPVTLSLTSDGRLFIEQSPVTPADLEKHLTAIHRAEPTRRIVLRGDISANYGAARELFAMCRRIGFSGVSLVVGEKHREPEGG